MSRVGWWVASLGYIGCWGVVAFGALGAAQPSVMATGVALAFVPYACLLHALGRPSADKNRPGSAELARTRRLALALALAFGVALLALPPLLSDDLYRYVWDGRVLAAGLEPYAHAPDAAPLAALRDAGWTHINHAELPTIYPPLAVLSFAATAWLGLLGPKLLALLGLLLLVDAVPRLTPSHRAAQAAFGVALNPLLLAEGPLHGHLDVLAAACVVLALVAIHQRASWLPTTPRPPTATGRAHLVRVDRRRAGRVWLWGTVSIGLKLVGLLLVPVLLAARGRRYRMLAVALLASGLLLMAPLSLAGYGDRNSESGLSHYARRWRGNDGAYGLIERGLERGLVARYGLRWGKLDLNPQPGWLGALERAGVDPWVDLVGPKKEPPPRDLIEPGVLARLLARGAVAGLWLLVAASLFVVPMPAPLGLRRLVLAACLLAPQLHPWYLALLVPLELITGRAAGMGLAAAMYAAYAPLDAWVATRTWYVEPLAPAAAHLFVAALIVVEVALSFRQRRTARLHER